MTGITVLIPVGPKPHHVQWLTECLDSIRAQTTPADEILIIDDGAHIPSTTWPDVRIWATPWTSGVVNGINFGVALAANPLVVLLGSDDMLRPWCIQDCLAAYEKHQDPLGYYWFDVEYSDGTGQSLASGPAMVTKALWEHTGGFPIEAAIGASDFMFLCAMNECEGRAGRQYHVESQAAPYWYRLHQEQSQSVQHMRFGSVIGLVRDQINIEWRLRWLGQA